LTFIAQTQADLDTVKARIAAVETEIAAAEAALPGMALRDALGRPEAGDELIKPRVAALHEHRADLFLALGAADLAERERIAEAKVREDASRQRALAQHLARIDKEAATVAAAAEHLQKSFVRLAEAGRAAEALLPPRLRAAHWFSYFVAPKHLRTLLQAELFRVGQSNAPAYVQKAFIENVKAPGNRGQLKTLVQLVAEKTAAARNDMRGQAPAGPMAHPHRPHDPMPHDPLMGGTHSAAPAKAAADAPAGVTPALVGAPSSRRIAPVEIVVDLTTGLKEPDVLEETAHV
jgi:hypothetical protein